MTAPKDVANLRQGRFGHFPRQEHRQLTGVVDAGHALLAFDGVDFQIKGSGDHLNNIGNRNMLARSLVAIEGGFGAAHGQVFAAVQPQPRGNLIKQAIQFADAARRAFGNHVQHILGDVQMPFPRPKFHNGHARFQFGRGDIGH